MTATTTPRSVIATFKESRDGRGARPPRPGETWEVRVAGSNPAGIVDFHQGGRVKKSKMILVARVRALAMTRLRQKGLTLAQIGERYGLSRQRVHQLLNYVPPLVGCDLDGTLADYHYSVPPTVNAALVRDLAGQAVVIVSNQGGVTRHLAGHGGRYPSPEVVASRLIAVVDHLIRHGVKVWAVGLATYHPDAPQFASAALVNLADLLIAEMDRRAVVLTISACPEDRKPAPGLLRHFPLVAYYGDEESDAAAAQAAAVEFVRVERLS